MLATIMISVVISVTVSVLVSWKITMEGLKRAIDFTSDQVMKTDKFYFDAVKEHIEVWHKKSRY